MRRRPMWTALLAGLSLAAAPASQPTTDDVVSLGNDVVRFHAPPSPMWTVRPLGKPSVNAVYFTTADRRSAMEFELTPPDYPLTADNVGSVAMSLVKALKAQRQHDGTVMDLPPKIERDRRFQIVIHERYKVGGATVDSLHLLKLVGPRTVMVVASTASADQAVVTGTATAAKDALASAKSNREGSRNKPPARKTGTIAP